jgi:hypothetical protein
MDVVCHGFIAVVRDSGRAGHVVWHLSRIARDAGPAAFAAIDTLEGEESSVLLLPLVADAFYNS